MSMEPLNPTVKELSSLAFTLQSAGVIFNVGSMLVLLLCRRLWRLAFPLE
jgi:hypothetical protein